MSDYKPPNKKNKKAKYTCPKCNSAIRLVTTYTGHDVEYIDEKTGEFVEDSHVYVERDDIHNVEWSCSNCPWEGDVEEK